MNDKTLSGFDLGLVAWEQWGQYGVPVFPCNDEKRPLGKWQQISSTDRDEITSQFAKRGDRAVMIGAVMGKRSELFAIDFDLYKGKDAQSYLDTLKASNALPDTLVHSTRSGGLHYIYGVPKGFASPRNAVPADGVEIRGEGGYIIVPPTPGYTVRDNEPVTDAPETLLSRLKRADEAFRALTASALIQKIVQAESFHEALALLAAKMHGAGKAPSEIMDTMLEALKGSVAASPNHHRHSRWRAIMEGKDGELARLSGSAYTKYNPRKDAVDTMAFQTQAVQSNRDVTAGGFFAPPPPDGVISGKTFAVADAAQTTAPVPANVSDFPFEKSYNAAGVSDQDDKRFLLYPLIMQSDVVVLSADPKAGKTMVTMNMCLHMAAGLQLNDELQPLGDDGKLAKIPVLYFALEGQGAIRKRIKAWLRYQKDVHGRALKEEDLRLFVIEQSVNLVDGEAKQRLVDKIVLANQYFINRGWGPIGMMVFDTFTKAMPGKDQNSVQDTSAAFEVIGMLRDVGVESAIVFVHHNNRHGKSPRGSSNIMAEPDTILSVSGGEDIIADGIAYKSLLLSVYIARSVDDTQAYRMKIHTVSIGVNSQGIEETAPVLETIDFTAPVVSKTDGTLMKKAAASSKEFYDVLYQLLADSTDMSATYSALHRKLLNKLSDAAKGYYGGFMNGTSAEQLKAGWKVLVAPHSVPYDFDGMKFVCTDNGISLKLDTASVA